jgi:CDP-paratose 2-epimerase
MKVLITGVCGFVGHALARYLVERCGCEVHGIDNFIRPGSETNRASLRRLGVRVAHGDIRSAADLENLPAVEWVIDAAANPSVLAGVDGRTSSRQLIEHNLGGTVELLEYCRRCGAGFVLLSTSRVYNISGLAAMQVTVEADAFRPLDYPPGVSAAGVSEGYSTASPVSLYGASKIASETLAVEYGATFGFPVWINRCGVLAGAGQFGRPDQGIFSYWIHSWKQRQPLNYIGFDGHGHQVRDCLHPEDLGALVALQINERGGCGYPQVVNVSGGAGSSRSLRNVSAWCEARWGAHSVGSVAEVRPFDIPWMVLDASLARATWQWQPQRTAVSIFEEIAQHAENDPHWLTLSAPF